MRTAARRSARDLLGRREAVEARHLDVEDGQVGAEVLDQLHRLVAAAGLAHDLVALVLEGLLEVEDLRAGRRPRSAGVDERACSPGA